MQHSQQLVVIHIYLGPVLISDCMSITCRVTDATM